MHKKTILKYTLSSMVVSLSVPFVVASPISAETGYTTDYTEKQPTSDTQTVDNNGMNQVDNGTNVTYTQPYIESTSLTQPDKNETGSSQVPNTSTAPLTSSDINGDEVNQSTTNSEIDDGESTLQDDKMAQGGDTTGNETPTDTIGSGYDQTDSSQGGDVTNEEPSAQPDDNVDPEPPQNGDTTGNEYPSDPTGDGSGQTEPPQNGGGTGEHPSSQPDDDVDPEPPQNGGTTGNEYPSDPTGDGSGQTEPPQNGGGTGEQPNSQPGDNVDPEPPQNGGTTGNETPTNPTGDGTGQTEPPQSGGGTGEQPNTQPGDNSYPNPSPNGGSTGNETPTDPIGGGSEQSNLPQSDGMNGGNSTSPAGSQSSQTTNSSSNDNEVGTSNNSNYADVSQSSETARQNNIRENHSTDYSGSYANPSQHQNDSLAYNQNKNATSSGAKPASTQTFGDLAHQQKDSNENTDSNVMNRFRQIAPGSFKYNPYVLKQVKALNNDDGNVSDRDINAVFSKQKFDDNAYLRELQKNTNYFKFQYFNPIKFDDYYKNLDNQVLSLITGEIGSMPDLKAPKTKKAQGAYEYEESDDTEKTQTRQEAEKADKGLKFERVLFALITGIIVIFIGVVTTYIIHRRK